MTSPSKLKNNFIQLSKTPTWYRFSDLKFQSRYIQVLFGDLKKKENYMSCVSEF